MTKNCVILNGGIFGKNSTILLKLFDIFINTGLICIGFEAEFSENIKKLAYLIRFFDNIPIFSSPEPKAHR